MFKFLSTGNDKYKEFYKNDEFIEGGNIQENFFEKYKEDFLNILNMYYNLQNEYGEVDLDESSHNDNSLFQKLNNIGEEIKKGISDSKILFRQENGKLIININGYLNSTVEGFIKEKYNYKDEDKFLYKGEHSVGFIYFLKQVKYLDNNEKEELTDYYDGFKSLKFSDIDELENVIDFYDKVRVEYLYDKFGFDYNKFDKKIYKILSFSSMGGYLKLLTFFKEQGIIKDFSDERSIAYPSNPYKVGTIELENITIDILTYKKENENILFLSVNEANKEVIEFLEKAYFSQKNIILNESKEKVAVLLGVGAEININENELFIFTDKLTTSNFGTTDVYEEIGKYNLRIRGIIDIRKDKMFSKKIIKKDIKIYEENGKEKSDRDKKINNYLIYGKYDKSILDFIVSNDLEKIGKVKDIYWDKYLDGSSEKIVRDYFVNTTLLGNEIENIIIEYIKYYIKNNEIGTEFQNIYSAFDYLLMKIFGTKKDSLLLNLDVERFVELELKKAYIEDVDFSIDREVWETKKIDEIVEFTEFCKFFNLDTSKYIGNHTMFKIYENTLKIKELTESEILFLKGKDIILNNIYNSFIHTDNYKYIDNLTGLLNYEIHKTMDIDLGQALRESDIESTTRILYLSKKFGIYKTLMWKKYFFKVKYNIDIVNFLKKNFLEVYDELMLESKKEEHLKINKNLELVIEKISILTPTGYSHILIRLDDDKIKFISDLLGNLNYNKADKLLKQYRVNSTNIEEKEIVEAKIREILGNTIDKGLEFFLNDLLLGNFKDFKELEKEYLTKFQGLLDGELCDNLNKEFFSSRTLEVISPKIKKYINYNKGRKIM